MMLRAFQKRFISRATSPGVDTAALSLPRGNGKSALAGHLLTRVLTPGDPLFRAGTESVLCAASLEQGRIVFRFARAALEGKPGYRFLDSQTRIGITHVPTNTRLRVLGSNGKTAMGLVNTPWAICDEPGAWEVNGGQLLNDAIQTAQGKPGSPLKAVYIGTLAPAISGWWHDMVAAGSHGSVYVQSLQGDPERWEQWPEIRRCNPLTAVSADFRKKLLEEREEARRDSRLKARFLSYRLNLPSADEATMLLTVDDWERVLARPVPPREGQPIVAYDMGHGRAWAAAVSLWRNGRVEALALAPGIPDLDQQEKRDRVPAGTYRALVASGALQVCEGLRVQPAADLHHAAIAAWGTPEEIVVDRFRAREVRDVVGNGIRIEVRRLMWSEWSEDIRALRKMALDGPLACAEASRMLLTASLAMAMVQNDQSGGMRLVKRDPANNTARDDVAAGLTIGAGLLQRRLSEPLRSSGWRYAGIVG